MGYNFPQFIGGVVVTKYRQDTPPEEVKRIRAKAHQLAKDHSDVWYWDWKKRKKVKVM